MLFFDIKFCDLKACGHWRSENTCAKNHLNMEQQLKFAHLYRDASECEARRQLDEFRLENILEGKS